MPDTNALGNDPLAIELGNLIEKSRALKGWNQKSLADGLDVSQAAVSKWECGDRYPKIGHLRKLANVFQWDDETFLKYALRDQAAA